jgi:hypothetical protein
MRTELSRLTFRPTIDFTYLALTVGLTTIFLANAIGAIVEPALYAHILQASPIARWAGLHRQSWATTLIAVNDGTIAVALLGAIVTRRYQRAVIAAAGGWLAIAAVLKLTASLGNLV